MYDGKAVALAILMADAIGGPTTDGVDDVDSAYKLWRHRVVTANMIHARLSMGNKMG